MTREAMGRLFYTDFLESWEHRAWQMSVGFRQPAAHSDCVQNSSAPDSKQKTALLALKRGGNKSPPPSMASGGQLQGKIGTTWEKKRTESKNHGWFWRNYFSIRISVTWGSAHKLDKQATLVLSDCINIIGQRSFYSFKERLSLIGRAACLNASGSFPQHFTAINYRFEYEVFLM